MDFLRRYALSIVIVLLAATLATTGDLLVQQGQTATQNCRLVRGLAHIESEFIRTDATDRKGALTQQERTRDIAAFRKIIAGVTKQARRQQALDTYTINYWRDVLVPEAEGLVSAARCPGK